MVVVSLALSVCDCYLPSFLRPADHRVLQATRTHSFAPSSYGTPCSTTWAHVDADAPNLSALPPPPQGHSHPVKDSHHHMPAVRFREVRLHLPDFGQDFRTVSVRSKLFYARPSRKEIS